ncbi:MAG: hypothetical protein ACI30B_08410 [Paludibacteraceae bacterium]
MKKHFLFAALLFAALSIGFIACDNDDEPHLDNDDDNNENVVDIEGEEDYYSCDSTEMVCTGKAYEITNSSARVDATIHIPVVLMASAKFGVQISTNLHDLQDHTNVKNCATKNLTSNNFTVILKPLAPGTTYYYCAYIYMDDVYIYGLIREFKTLGESENGYGYVDLGLSSGLKWAACNVGAITPEEYGNYYAWGETTPKTAYKWSTYKWCDGYSNRITKYCTDSDYGDNKTVLDKEDDAAAVNMGGSWRMPTFGELYELETKCTWTWTTQNSKKGYLVTSKTNGNSIFLPAAGCHYDGDLYNWPDGYWSSSLYSNGSDYAYYLCIYSGGLSLTYNDNDRCIGRSVRGVCE